VTAPSKTGRLTPIILKSAVNLIQLQKQLKGVVSENFEFRSTTNGTRVIMRHGGFPVCQIPLRQPKSVLLLLLPKICKAHKGGDMPPATKHPCRRYF
jgi:hypothetical protein